MLVLGLELPSLALASGLVYDHSHNPLACISNGILPNLSGQPDSILSAYMTARVDRFE